MHTDELATLIGQNVRECRVERRVRAETAAATIDLALSDYEACEAGVIRFTSGQLVLLCALLDAMPSRFFRPEH